MSAPEGNNYAVGYGRPPIYEDTEDSVKTINELIKQYFEWIEGEEGQREVEFINNNGDKETIKENYWIRRPEPPTVTGLTLHLNFADKSTLYDYSKKQSFSHSIKKALTRIEKYHETKTSYGDKCTGNIFVLKNFGWVDRQEIKQTIQDNRQEIDYTELSKEELLKYATNTTQDL